MNSEAVYESVLKVGVWTAIVAVAIQTVAHFLYVYVWPSLLLNADNDWATFAWASSVITFTGALAAATMAAIGPDRGPKLALAVILLLFSFDDGARMHERFADQIDSLLPWEEAGRAAGMILLLPLMVVAFVILWRISSRETSRVRWFIRLGLGMLGAAVLLEAVVSTLVHNSGRREFDLLMALEVVVEEGAELGGWILIVTALAALSFRALLSSDLEGAGGEAEP